jgi:hypothetical protein
MEDNTQVPKLLRALDRGAIIIPLPVLRHLDIWGSSENHNFSLGHIHFHTPVATELVQQIKLLLQLRGAPSQQNHIICIQQHLN